MAAALLTATLILTACSSGDDDSASTGETRAFEADNGTIEIPTDPQRIVALGSASVYLSLGVEPVGMPRASETELPWLSAEEVQVNEAATDLSGDVDYEEVASLEPDLIVIFDPAHVWEGGESYNEERLQSIAPTVYVELSTERWKTQVERLADAVGELDNFEADRDEYEALAADIADEHEELLGSTTFMVLNRWGGDFTQEAGTLYLEYPAGYCVNHLVDAGLEIVPDEPDIGTELSMEQLSDTVAEADVIIYPLGADGNVTPEFAPVLESNIWSSLPQVQAGRALGVQCDLTLTYSSKIPNLESLDEALGTLPEAG